jgi:hypothetical protein
MHENMIIEYTEKRPSILKIMLIWTPLLLWYAAVFFFSHSQKIFRNVDSLYYNAIHYWVSHQPLYVGGLNGRFIYFPTTVALFSPFAGVSLKTFELIYHLISVFFLTLGVYFFTKSISKNNTKNIFYITLIVTMFLSQAAFFQGQLHFMTTGILLLGYAAIAREKWWQSAIWLALALALKPTSIVLCLLALALYPKVSWRLLLCTLLFFLFPFFLEPTHYVAGQYSAFVTNFLMDMHFDGNHPEHWATVFGVIAFYFHYLVVGSTQFIIRILAAFSVFGLCVYIKMHYSKKEAAFFIFTLGMCYLMLFNSRTENNDYIMIAPAIGYSLALAVNQKKLWEIIGFSSVIFLLMMNWNLSKVLTPHNNTWLSPTLIIGYSVWLLILICVPRIKSCLQSRDADYLLR